MIAGLLKVDEAIYESNKIICRQISRLGESTRGEVSQEVLESLRHFVEHIILKEYANGGDIEDTHENLKVAVKYVKNEPQLIHLSRFHNFLQVSSSHRVLKEHNAERLMIRYYEYLFRIRKFLYDKYSMLVLENIAHLPLDTNDELSEYYTKIATVVDRYNAPIHGGFRYDRFYVQKIKPFFRTAWFCPRSCRMCCRSGKFVEIPISRSKRRRRTIFNYLFCSCHHIRIYVIDIRHRHRAAYTAKCHWCLHTNAAEMEILRNSYLFGTGSDHDLLCRNRRMDHQIRSCISYGSVKSGCCR